MDNTNYDSKHTGPEIDAAIDRAKAGGEIDTLLQSKADASSVYTKTESDTLLQSKADASSVYTKTESDTLLAGKAPAGYGLGGSATKTVETDFNNYIDNGVYTIPGSMESIQNAPPRGAYGMLIVSHGSSAIVQDVYSPDWASSAVRWNHVRRVCTNYDGNADFWSEWEWPEPPMEIGVEYRTTEQYQGKPVYVKTVDCGAMPSSGRKSVTHSISDIENVVRCIGQRSNGDSIPIRYTGTNYASIYAGKTYIHIFVGTDMSETTATAQLWYTKTTD